MTSRLATVTTFIGNIFCGQSGHVIYGFDREFNADYGYQNYILISITVYEL